MLYNITQKPIKTKWYTE